MDPGILGQASVCSIFVIGMTCGLLVHDGMVDADPQNPLATVIAGASIFVVFSSFHSVYTSWPVDFVGRRILFDCLPDRSFSTIYKSIGSPTRRCKLMASIFFREGWFSQWLSALIELETWHFDRRLDIGWLT